MSVKSNGVKCDMFPMRDWVLRTECRAGRIPAIMQTGPLLIEESVVGGERILRLDGPLTLPNIFQFQTVVRADRSRSLIVDLTNVPYVDSAGIGSLVGAHVSRENNRTLTLVGTSQRVREALRVTKVEQFFRMAGSVDEALEGGRSQAAS